MTTHAHVNPWTSPLDLNVGDRAVNASGQVMEWDGHRGIPVCGPCDKRMAEQADGGFRCPSCSAVFGEPLPLFGGDCERQVVS